MKSYRFLFGSSASNSPVHLDSLVGNQCTILQGNKNMFVLISTIIIQKIGTLKACQSLGVFVFLGSIVSRPYLQVRLSVQIRRLNVALGLTVGGDEEDEVGRKRLFTFHSDDVAHEDVFPSHRHPVRPSQNFTFRVVYLLVFPVPLEVFVDLLDGRDGEDDPKGPNSDPSASGRNARDLLQKPDAEEEDIGILAKLLVQEFGDECQNGVFSRRD